MTIAVVGATGNTGRAVVKELKSLGQNPIASCAMRTRRAKSWAPAQKSRSPN